jgi:hypothetical protein
VLTERAIDAEDSFLEDPKTMEPDCSHPGQLRIHDYDLQPTVTILQQLRVAPEGQAVSPAGPT